ncbi:hypothetical protein [Actinacidiphila acidipaludis]|uniref:Uncharacterized protein n=1 Tax=Actinacidiphila acidipaludis TaxID=2873382 RepID=A0ABS7QIH3_9ACTN|nr:hypothetical protein [Streptomyces acidipaludis]MBY8881579.1 hypothetical protein [Streptomyces acidipaludis]
MLPAAFEAFVELYYVPHLVYADAQLGSQEQAEDVVDETSSSAGFISAATTTTGPSSNPTPTSQGS